MKIVPMKVELLDHMGSDLTFTQKRIMEARSRGYYLAEGVLYGPKGVLIVKKRGTQRYPTFTTNWGGRVFGVPVHQFAAHVYYGLLAFQLKTVVRHLDANTENISKENIVLGTHSQNNLDKPPAARKAAAQKARASQGATPHNAKLNSKQVEVVRKFYAELQGKKAPNGVVKNLATNLGVSRTVLLKIKNGEYYASV